MSMTFIEAVQLYPIKSNHIWKTNMIRNVSHCSCITFKIVIDVYNTHILPFDTNNSANNNRDFFKLFLLCFSILYYWIRIRILETIWISGEQKMDISNLSQMCYKINSVGFIASFLFYTKSVSVYLCHIDKV